MGTQLRLTNEDTQATVHVHVFENGNPFGTPTAIAPGDNAAVTVTSSRKLVVTLAGVNTDDVPHRTVPNVGQVQRSADSPMGPPLPQGSVIVPPASTSAAPVDVTARTEPPVENDEKRYTSTVGTSSKRHP